MKITVGGIRSRVLMCVAGSFTAIVLIGTAAFAQGPPASGTPGAARGEGRQGRAGRGIQALYPVLPIGSALPDFSLLGIDGKRHTPQEYEKAKVLVVMFESNHCPASIAYEHRMLELYKAYGSRDVRFIAINPNNPKAVRLNELGYTDMTDSFEEMKLRAAFMDLPWLYLYDGETQALSDTQGPSTTLEVPGGTTIPLASNADYNGANLRALEKRSEVMRDSINYFPPMANQACRIGFFADLGSRAMAYDQVDISSRRACIGRLYFLIPGGITYGQYFLNVKFENSLIRVPFRVFTKEEEKLLSKNYKSIKKQVDEAFKPKKN